MASIVYNAAVTIKRYWCVFFFLSQVNIHLNTKTLCHAQATQLMGSIIIRVATSQATRIKAGAIVMGGQNFVMG